MEVLGKCCRSRGKRKRAARKAAQRVTDRDARDVNAQAASLLRRNKQSRSDDQIPANAGMTHW